MGEYAIPEGVTEISKYAFAYYESLTSITIPNSVKKIDERAFYGCKNLQTINFIGNEEEWNLVSKGNYWNSNVHSDCQIIFKNN